MHARFTKRQIIDREVLCDAIDALRLLGRWGFLSRNSQVRLAGTSLPEATFRSPHFQQYIFLLFLCSCALGNSLLRIVHKVLNFAKSPRCWQVKDGHNL